MMVGRMFRLTSSTLLGIFDVIHSINKSFANLIGLVASSNVSSKSNTTRSIFSSISLITGADKEVFRYLDPVFAFVEY